MSAYATLEDLRSQLGGGPKPASSDPAYAAKMLHPLPPVQIADRVACLVTHATGKRVLEFGASGPAHDKVRAASAAYLGVDRTASDGVVAFDLDDVSVAGLPPFEAPDVIICGEVLEHLGNPQWFLQRLRAQYPGVPVVITVPNAYSEVALRWLAKGKENVNADHVAWYSPKTLSTLLQRSGYGAGTLYYYGGTDPMAEGLLVVTE